MSLFVASVFLVSSSANPTTIVEIRGPNGKPFPAKKVLITKENGSVYYKMTQIKTGFWKTTRLPQLNGKVEIDITRIDRDGKSQGLIPTKVVKWGELIEVNVAADEVNPISATGNCVPYTVCQYVWETVRLPDGRYISIRKPVVLTRRKMEICTPPPGRIYWPRQQLFYGPPRTWYPMMPPPFYLPGRLPLKPW